MRPARTGVVVLNYGDPADTFACVRSLERNDDLDLDLAVIDNGPEGPAHDALRAGLPGGVAVLATGENLGYAAGNNVGIRRALERDCELVWILNPDTVVGRRTLPRLRRHLAHVPDCGVVGPRLILPGDPPTVWFDGGVVDESRYGATTHLGIGVPERESAEPRAIDVDYVMGASMLVRREVFESVGLLPERYFLYFEEADWCRSVRDAGWRTMVDQQARMVHHKRSSDALPRPYYLYYMVRNRVLFAADRLGLDADGALDDVRASFVQPWRERVARRAPHWLSSFDELVEAAATDARAGRDGRNDSITHYPTADEPTAGMTHA